MSCFTTSRPLYIPIPQANFISLAFIAGSVTSIVLPGAASLHQLDQNSAINNRQKKSEGRPAQRASFATVLLTMSVSFAMRVRADTMKHFGCNCLGGQGLGLAR